MRNILSILCTLILPTMVEAASCGFPLMEGHRHAQTRPRQL